MIRIAVCGLDGIGKTTLIEKLNKKLSQQGLTVAKAKVPFVCKTLMANSGYENLSEFELVRRIGMAFEFTELYCALNVNADILLCDRYDIDFEVLNDVYNVPQNYKDIMHAIYMKAPRPNLCFYLRGDYTLAAERLIKRGDRKDFENDDILMSMQSSFEKRIYNYPNSVIIDANKTVDGIADEAYGYIRQVLKNKKLK